MYNFDKLIQRRGTNSYKWDMIARKYKNDELLPMWVADMDFEIAPEIAEAVKKRADHLTYGYTYAPYSFYESIINWNKKRNDYDLKKEWMNVSIGVVPSIKAAIYGFTEKGDKVLIQTPVYPPFHHSVTAAKRELVTSSLIFDGEKFNIDFDDFENKIKSGVKLFILSNPHNPVGRLWTREELEKIADICYDNNVKIVSDEIHSDVIFRGNKHTVFSTVSEKAGKISIICAAPSKTFNIAGLSTSYIIVENEVIRKQMWDAMDFMGISSVNLFGLTAGEAAYIHGEKWLDEMLEYVEGNADFVCEYIDEKLPKIKAYKAQSTYLMWLDFRKYGMTQTELTDKLINEAQVVLNSGADFGEEGIGFMRLNIGCPRSMVKQCLDRICEAFK
ncbi:MAG TPA: cystathionine beta-lyase [Clostridiales bacterium]|nr:cystathionine beta-lyase [Clostridiales bacterium]